MRRHRWQAAGFLVVVLAAALATGQNNPAVLKADIPFPFVVANHTLLAGHYVVSTLGEQTIRIANSHKQGAFVLTSKVDGRASESLGNLVFYRYEDSYFPAQVWNPDNQGKQVFKSPDEEELERKGASRKISVLRAEN
jgi:hypothetical protein